MLTVSDLLVYDDDGNACMMLTVCWWGIKPMFLNRDMYFMIKAWFFIRCCSSSCLQPMTSVCNKHERDDNSRKSDNISLGSAFISNHIYMIFVEEARVEDDFGVDDERVGEFCDEERRGDDFDTFIWWMEEDLMGAGECVEMCV